MTLLLNHKNHPQHLSPNHSATMFGRPASRRVVPLRRRKLPAIRLGGKQGFFLKKMVKKMRVRWVKLQYMRVLKKLKEYYEKMVKDIIKAGESLEGDFQKRIFAEATFALPVMGVSFHL
ncbi:uncharacterized protein LOC110824775 [Carica papaya]|uniref:uncharacterized protein LOC110824775 n=1 Tax=Carica papaya TaxID=3649 RepID=UPI000B8CFCCA|nr:uncharacterized protein LOC110824775 [Carica papaya]